MRRLPEMRSATSPIRMIWNPTIISTAERMSDCRCPKPVPVT
jgi:hypothetical protein